MTDRGNAIENALSFFGNLYKGRHISRDSAVKLEADVWKPKRQSQFDEWEEAQWAARRGSRRISTDGEIVQANPNIYEDAV